MMAITAEMIKPGGELLHERIKKVCVEKMIPKNWTTAEICPIYKKGNKQTYENYLGIALL